jgi:hypothetical protein
LVDADIATYSAAGNIKKVSSLMRVRDFHENRLGKLIAKKVYSTFSAFIVS